MNDLLLNILQPRPAEGGDVLQPRSRGAAAPDPEGIGFGALLASFLPAGPNVDADDQLLFGAMTNGSENTMREISEGKISSLLSDVLPTMHESAVADTAVGIISEPAPVGEGNLKLIPVAFIPVLKEASLLYVANPDHEIANLLESVTPTLQSYLQDAGSVIDGKSIYPEQAVSLKLELGESTMVVPVEVSTDTSGRILELSIMTDGRLALSNVDPYTMATLDVKAAIEKAIPAQIQENITGGTEVSVKQIIVLAEPQKFARKYLTDLVESESRRSDDSKPGIKVDTSTKTTNSERLGIADKASAFVADARSTADNQRTIDQRPMGSHDTNHQSEVKQQSRPDVRLDIDKLARQSIMLPETGDKNLPKIAFTDGVPQVVEIAAKPSIQQVALPESISGSTNAARRVPAEPVAFKVLLPDAQIKIADMSTFRISIQPESLGHVRVHLAVVDDQLTARLSVESAAAKHMVESNLPVLRESLQQQGIKVESFAVNISDRDHPDRQHGHKREPLSRKQKGGMFSLDSFDRTDAQVPARGVTSSTNLSGHLNLVA
ncbi:MAG: flagellar hook-length control protein FliK [Candidatus Zixiibacteriota bacterium]